MDDTARIQSILQANTVMVVSTADGAGKPWVTPVSYTFDAQNCLYWVSSKDARHSVNVRARKEVAIVIYMLEPARDAVYIEAKAQELVTDAEITSAMATINTRTQPEKYRVTSISDVSGQASWRIYKAVPKTVYVREQSTVGGQAVTVRRKIASRRA
jgi:nitroimidazol reductase NimA-like FMN-containing flavoprotein (pyridoxamine 5'-phosphate oxidase superfamily)